MDGEAIVLSFEFDLDFAFDHAVVFDDVALVVAKGRQRGEYLHTTNLVGAGELDFTHAVMRPVFASRQRCGNASGSDCIPASA